MDNRKGGLSHSSLRNHSKVLKQVLDSAVIYEYISKNVATRVPIPKLATDTNESKAVFLNATEANKLLSAFKKHRLQPLLYVTLYFGLRRSEILGLKWDAIDIPELNPHELRHTVASVLVNNDKNLFAIANLLGWGDLKMLRQRYAHVDVESTRKQLGY